MIRTIWRKNALPPDIDLDQLRIGAGDGDRLDAAQRGLRGAAGGANAEKSCSPTSTCAASSIAGTASGSL